MTKIQTLKPNPQKLPQKESMTLKSDLQNAWQTLKKFDYPIFFIYRTYKYKV
ncbi:MAG: hypothetical protein IJV29_16415 [Butyrivibrio sp.]|nr:hypothetical protein [Butyrivibrio sp.]